MREQCRDRLYSSLSDHAILFQTKVRFFHYPVCFKSEVFINRNVIGIMGFQRNQHLVFLGIIYHLIHQKFCQSMMLVSRVYCKVDHMETLCLVKLICPA